MESNEIKKANRKAMPKFILIMVISAIVGGTMGFFSAKYGLDALAGSIKAIGEFFGMYLAPWVMLAIALIVPVVSVPLYKNTKKLLSTWDGEDEAEKIMIGKCAFKAYSATNIVCTVLAIVLALCSLIFGIGFLPSLIVCLIWLVNQSVYCKEALKYSKAGNKLS